MLVRLLPQPQSNVDLAGRNVDFQTQPRGKQTRKPLFFSVLDDHENIQPSPAASTPKSFASNDCERRLKTLAPGRLKRLAADVVLLL